MPKENNSVDISQERKGGNQNRDSYGKPVEVGGGGVSTAAFSKVLSPLNLEVGYTKSEDGLKGRSIKPNSGGAVSKDFSAWPIQ